MTDDEYYRQSGDCLTTSKVLEFALRAYLQQLPNARVKGKDDYNSPVGVRLNVNDLTSYDSLRRLIETANKYLQARGSNLIDVSLVEVRDVFAHGRVFSMTSGGTQRLLKFSKPLNDEVEVMFNEELTYDWFARHIKRTCDAVQILARVCNAGAST